MIKFALAGLWLCIAALGAAFYAAQEKPAVAETGEPAKPVVKLDTLKTEIISVPLVRNSAVQGYMLARLAFTIEAGKAAKLQVPPDLLLTDEVYTWAYGHPPFDLKAPKPVDVEAFRAGVRESVNKRVGEELLHDVLIEQIDFLSKDEIRDNAIRRRTSKPKTDDAESGGGHKVASPDAHF
ncbi:hypothetical protein NGM99_14920 [Mesorhizobium sp. RP14(2022)]|uniref:Uncharacterized protein n=1 Tax=Mesorhizobium liriopis TaxID=2953882 RepID=A0ABT1C8D2_9HYPH|nr:hypothetical protein [Mesorhizobium liriopis]MCO6051074.1 hypothetical protein [Mesorhizobium liriopis]